MNQLLQWLSEGDLRSDGLSNEVADLVLQQPQLIVDLVIGLSHNDDLIRGRTADALEKIGRSRPDLLRGLLPDLMKLSRQDQVAMVKMHLAMIFGHLAIYEDYVGDLADALLDLLGDEKVFAVSWAISSLCIIGRMYPSEQNRILQQIVPLERHPSIAIRSRVKKALILLTNEESPFPKGWNKSMHLQV